MSKNKHPTDRRERLENKKKKFIRKSKLDGAERAGELRRRKEEFKDQETKDELQDAVLHSVDLSGNVKR